MISEAKKAASARWRSRNREPLATKQRARYQATKDHHLVVVKEWQRKNPHKTRAYHRRKDGLPEPTRPEPDICECCGKPPPEWQSLHLDHCHTTGVFRGWLCFSCNTSIGRLGDNEEGLMKALSYLRRRFS